MSTLRDYQEQERKRLELERQLGKLSEEAGRYTEAHSFQKAIELRYQLIQLCETNGLNDRAANHYNLLSSIYGLGLNDPKKAIECLEMAIASTTDERKKDLYERRIKGFKGDNVM